MQTHTSSLVTEHTKRPQWTWGLAVRLRASPLRLCTQSHAASPPQPASQLPAPSGGQSPETAPCTGGRVDVSPHPHTSLFSGARLLSQQIRDLVKNHKATSPHTTQLLNLTLVLPQSLSSQPLSHAPTPIPSRSHFLRELWAFPAPCL